MESAGDTSRWISKCGPDSGTENRRNPPPISVGGRIEVTPTEGEAVATGDEITSPTGVATVVSEESGVGVAITTLAIASSAPGKLPEELQDTVSKRNSSAINNAGALGPCQREPVRKSVVNGNLLLIGGATIDRYQSAYR